MSLPKPTLDTDLGALAESTRDLQKRIDEMIEELEERLQAIGDDAQLANIDLQSALQKSQQTIQLMTNVSKMIHDTIMAEIRKIG